MAALKRKPVRRKSSGRHQGDDTGRPFPPMTGKNRVRSGNKWGFRLAAAALPLVFLALLEGGLRLAGYGYPTGYFLKAEVAGKPVWIENQDFTRRFFPPGLARTPLPLVLPREKAPGTTRVFIFGESAAMGDPAPAFGFGRQLEVMLQARFPGRRFEVANLATTAINSHVIREIAKDCVHRDGDIWVLYIGNNEVVGPYGAGTVFGVQAPGLGWIRARLAFKTTRLGQWLDGLSYRLLKSKDTPAAWEGMEMFLNQQVRQSDPALARVYHHFQKNLEDILAMGRSAGAKILLCTVASNLKDCPPFASLPGRTLTRDEQARWESSFAAGTNWAAQTNNRAALQSFADAERLDAGSAELQFRVGECERGLGKLEEAKRRFEKARDLDTLRFRADTRINHIIRQLARSAGSADLKLLDAEEVIAAQSPDGVTGGEYLYEHVHFNFEGNYLLARAVAEQIESWVPHSGHSAQPGSAWLSSKACADRLAWTDWDRLQVFKEVAKRLELPPFTHQWRHQERTRRWQDEVARVQANLAREGLNRSVETYRGALDRSPGDWVLREHFADLLENTGGLEEAVTQWRRLLELVPHSFQAYYRLGNTLDKLGRSAHAADMFREALRLQPKRVEARNGLALALDNLKETDAATRLLEATLADKPDFVEARVNLGEILFRKGQIAAAREQYEAALRYNSNSLAAQVNLGRLLSDQKLWSEAVEHYRAALAIDPSNAPAHFNLGNLLSTLHDPEAAAHYEAAVRADPSLAEARFNYGLVLASQHRNLEALAQFQEVARLRPNFAEGHLNLGVALAKEKRFDEAIDQFQETLRLDPGNSMARDYLDKARVRAGNPPSP
jgi:tetratricopeptide (TPR) repeat protein